jgi:hypothetical protein
MEFKIEYVAILFCIFLGTGFQFTQTQNTNNYTTLQRLYASLTTIVLVGLFCCGLLYSRWQLNFWVTCIFGLLLGIPAEKGLRLFMKYFEESTDFFDFVDRLWKAYKLTKNKPNDPNQTPS